MVVLGFGMGLSGCVAIDTPPLVPRGGCVNSELSSGDTAFNRTGLGTS